MPGSLDELRAALAVAEHKSFRAAATALHVSPSALSHTIATLEERLGVRLFNRTTRSVAVSQAGAQFLARIGPALREISDAVEQAAEQRASPAGLLRINTSVGGASRLGPAVFATLKRYPDLEIDVVADDGLVDIVAGGFDAGVRGGDVVPRDMVAVPFGPEVEFAIVGAPSYFVGRTRPKTPAELTGHACIRRRWPSGAIYRWELEKHGREVNVDVRGPLVVDTDALNLEAALAGVGLAYVTLDEAAPHLRAKRLVRVLADWTPAYPGLRLYYPARRHLRPALRAFVDVLRDVLPAS